MRGSEWIFEIKLSLPFGWKLIRVKKKFEHLPMPYYRKWHLYRLHNMGVGTYREEYWPKPRRKKPTK